MAWFGKKNSLLRDLGSDDSKKRNQAARELFALGEEGAESLLTVFAKEDENAKKIAAQILIKLDGKAIPVIQAAFREAPLEQKKEMISVLGGMKDNDARQMLFNLLKHKQYKVRIFTLQALSNHADEETIRQVLAALSDEDPDVRIAAIYTLGSFRAPQTYLHLADRLDDPEINVRIAAAKVLGEIKSLDTLPDLLDALKDSFWWYERDEAIQVLLQTIASFGDAALDDLLAAMKEPIPTLRRYAIQLLRQLKDPRIMESLEMAFYDPNYDVAENALVALLDFGEASLPILQNALHNPNAWLRQKAAWGLGEIGGQKATNLLLAIVGDQDEDEVRKEAIRALAKLKNPRTLPTLRAISENRSDKEIARLARQAIAQIEAG